jgi:hypothetical protein
MPYKYLEIAYGDNDFCIPVKEALKKIWEFVNGNIHNWKGRTEEEVFVYLHKAGLLEPMIARLIDLEYMANEVDHITRGPAYGRIQKEPPPAMGSVTERYLHFTITFQEGKEFLDEWQDMEHAALGLKNGVVKLF